MLKESIKNEMFVSDSSKEFSSRADASDGNFQLCRGIEMFIIKQIVGTVEEEKDETYQSH